MSDQSQQFDDPVERFVRERKRMVDNQIRMRGITDQRLLNVMEAVPRHAFVAPKLGKKAYEDSPLPIGGGQTISQPYIVAYMIEQLQLHGSEKVLEIGTGSGYQTALLAELAREVYSLEIFPELSQQAQRVLDSLGYDNVHLKIDDGYRGWPETGPFNSIIVSAAPPEIPPNLVKQLAIEGRMILPVGDEFQKLALLINHGDHVEQIYKLPVRFVPLTHR